ncbi:hypothetical protein Y032_0229g2895 [Ancylostoma ceylanicum]|uniref:Uncharacterized protein n=1 Tax=Ancylostoma ceylanicum TaxID=53326 RepID=A0A016SGA6_9BILA|nr:hypothetical protein Y032_0229g2895 [Ancylostoma ceylanicum]
MKPWLKLLISSYTVDQGIHRSYLGIFGNIPGLACYNECYITHLETAKENPFGLGISNYTHFDSIRSTR